MEKDGSAGAYPHKFSVSIGLAEFVDKYTSLEKEEEGGEDVSVAGEMIVGHTEEKMNKRATSLYSHNVHITWLSSFFMGGGFC